VEIDNRSIRLGDELKK